jgi:2-enoate reductase
MGRFGTGRPLSCAVNPACGRESLYHLSPSLKKRKIVVVGGGVAGMEAARVAESRGHQVVLYEKGDELGGHLVEASVPNFKKDLCALLTWYKRQLNTSGVEIKMGTEASVETVIQENPDVVIIATGSKVTIPNVPGVMSDKVVTCIDILLGKKQAGENVVVIGGGLVGCETALWLAQDGKRVTLVEMLPQLMSGGIRVPPMNKTMLLDLLIFYNVVTLTGCTMQAIKDEGVVVKNSKYEEKRIQADTVLLAVGLSPVNALYHSLIDKFPEVYDIGDCQEPRNIMAAVWNGYELGRAL